MPSRCFAPSRMINRRSLNELMRETAIAILMGRLFVPPTCVTPSNLFTCKPVLLPTCTPSPTKKTVDPLVAFILSSNGCSSTKTGAREANPCWTCPCMGATRCLASVSSACDGLQCTRTRIMAEAVAKEPLLVERMRGYWLLCSTQTPATSTCHLESGHWTNESLSTSNSGRSCCEGTSRGRSTTTTRTGSNGYGCR